MFSDQTEPSEDNADHEYIYEGEELRHEGGEGDVIDADEGLRVRSFQVYIIMSLIMISECVL